MKGYIEIEKYRVLEAQNKTLTEQVEAFKFQLEQFKRMIFGAKSERYVADRPEEQLSLFQIATNAPAEAPKVNVPAHDRKKSKPKKKPARLVLPDHLCKL